MFGSGQKAMLRSRVPPDGSRNGDDDQVNPRDWKGPAERVREETRSSRHGSGLILVDEAAEEIAPPHSKAVQVSIAGAAG
jgi:hypothetical protein